MKNVFADMAFGDEIKIAPSIKAYLFDINGLILKSNVLMYYGSDFSGFYSNWKTGKIGLKALSGKGLFQSTLNEDMLSVKGFVKKDFPA